RNDGAATGDLVAYELRGNVLRNGGAEALAIGQRRFGALEHRFASQVLTMGDVDHLLGDDAGAGVLELRQRLALDAAEGPRLVREVAGERLAGDIAVILRPNLAPVVLLDVAALADPSLANARQTLLDVDRRARVGVRAGGIIDTERRLVRIGERDLAEGHAQPRTALGGIVDLRAGVDRPGGDLRHHQLALAGDLVHHFTPGSGAGRSIDDARKSLIARNPGMRRRRRVCASVRPFAGMTRIRFKGWRRGFSAISAGCRRP